MRIQVLSDLHIEFKGNSIPALAPHVELVILAGDLAPVRTRGVAEIAERWRRATHILYVPGNHEFHGSDIDDARLELARQCQRDGVTLLDRQAITIDGLHFIGATLWTDFLLDGVVGEHWAHHEARRNISDFMGAIRDRSAPGGLLATRETTLRDAEDRSFIEVQLREAHDAGLIPIVITHHAPSPRCVRPWYAGSALNAAFASDLDCLIARFQPPLWVHGHMHDLVDERLGDTRVVANPQGYPGWESRSFNPELVIEM